MRSSWDSNHHTRIISKLTHVREDCGLSKVLETRTSYTWRLVWPATLETGKRIWKNVRNGTEDHGLWTWILGIEWLCLLPLPTIIYQNSLEIHLLICLITKQKCRPQSTFHSGMMSYLKGKCFQVPLRTGTKPTRGGWVHWAVVLPPKLQKKEWQEDMSS